MVIEKAAMYLICFFIDIRPIKLYFQLFEQRNFRVVF